MTRHSPRAKRPRCKECNGAGKMRQMIKTAGMVFAAQYGIRTCPTCKGTGREPRV